MSELAKSRWEGIQQTEAEMREYFQTAPLDDILERYQTMRKHYEQAGAIVNHRVNTERNVEECANCGTKLGKEKGWYNREVVKDPETGTVSNIFSCSQACFMSLKRKQNNPRLVSKH